MTHLSERLAQLKSENRAAFIAYLPAGFPTVEKSKAAIEVLVKNGAEAPRHPPAPRWVPQIPATH